MTYFATIYGVGSLAELKQEYPSSLNLVSVLGPTYPLTEAQAWYMWVSTSTNTPDDNEWILSDFPQFATMGRWNKIDLDLPPQLNADWTASTGVSAILNKPTSLSQFSNDPGFVTAGTLSGYVTNSTFSSTLTNYATASSLVSGLSTKYNVPTGTTSQYLRGDGSLATFPSIPAAPSQSAATRALNTAFQVSSTRGSLVTYSVQITVTANISSGQQGDVILEIASDSAFTTNVQTLSIAGNGQTYTLAVAIQGVQPTTNVVSGFVPAGYYVRLRTVSVTGTPTFSYRAGQEVLM